MTIISGFSKLPKKTITSLKAAKDVKYRNGTSGDISIIDLRDSAEGVNIFMNYLLQSGEVNVGVIINFGIPTDSFVSRQTETEVYGLLNTYSSLTMTNSITGDGVYPPFNPDFDSPGIYRFYNPSIGLHAVLKEIQTSDTYLASCPLLAGLPIGNTICNITFIYKGYVVGMALKRC